MNTREKMHRFSRERRDYIELCRIQYGYGYKPRARAIGASNMAGLVSALFGCGLTLALFTVLNATLLDILKPFQLTSASDILAMITSCIMG